MTDIKKMEKIIKKYKPRCYYNDELCEGKIIPVDSFKRYLCEKCAKEDNSIEDEPLDHDFRYCNK